MSTSTDYGKELSCVTDFSYEQREVSGPAVVVESIARRLTTPRGMLIDDADYGTDLRDYLGLEYTGRIQARLIGEVKAECLKDERVKAVNVVILSFSTAGRSISLRIEIVLADGPFVFVLTVDALDANIQLITAR